MNKVKVPVETFLTLRKKVKFLEHYWFLYGLKNDANLFKHASTVEKFISSHFYDQIDGFKVNRFSQTVTLTQDSYDNLRKYASLSDELALVVKLNS